MLWENDASGSVTAISRVAFDVDGMGGEAVMMAMSCPVFTMFEVAQSGHSVNDPRDRVAVQQQKSLVGLAGPTEKPMQM